MTPETLRTQLADLLDDVPADEDSLPDLGLDSIRLMTVVQRLRAAGHDVAFADLAEEPTLAAWSRVLAGGARR